MSSRICVLLAGFITSALATSLANAPPLSAAPTESTSATVQLEECRERFVVAPGVEEQVRAVVPTQFELSRNSAGQPLLYVTAIHCERYIVDGVGRPTTVAAFGASILPPDGTACFSRVPVVKDVKPDAASCNVYLIFAAYDNPDVVTWARAGTPDVPVHFNGDLAFDEGELDPTKLGIPLRFAAPSTPSAYDLELIVRERPIGLPAPATFWHAGSQGTVRMRFDTPHLEFGEADGSLRVEPGSQMAELFGTPEPTAQRPFPLLAGNHWESASITKTLLP